MAPRPSSDGLPQGRLACLTEMSVLALVAGSLTLSALLWLAILAVL